MIYLLDTNVFITAKNLHYVLIFVLLLGLVDFKNKEEKVFSIRKVSDEINKGKDNLSKWAKK